MIKIVSDNIENALKEHWKWVKKRLQLIENDEDENEDHRGSLSKESKDRLFELLGFLDSDETKNIQSLKALICVPPRKLKSFRNCKRFASLVKVEPDEYVKWKKKPHKSKSEIKQGKRKYKEYIEKEKRRNAVFELLGYNSLHNKESKWNAFRLCEMLKINICPYCNRQYVYTTKNKKGKWATSPQLDHFYTKSKYPFLSCSFFNLIPSCPTCNMGKNDNDTETLYPYLEGFRNLDGSRNAQFRIESNMVDEIFRLGTVNPDINYTIELKRICDPDEHIKGSDEVFNLTILYNEHQVELRDLIKRYLIMIGAELGDYSKPILGKDLIDCNDKERETLQNVLLGLPLLIDNDQQYLLKIFKEDIISQLSEQN